LENLVTEHLPIEFWDFQTLRIFSHTVASVGFGVSYLFSQPLRILFSQKIPQVRKILFANTWYPACTCME
jgi:hypothetical protein